MSRNRLLVTSAFSALWIAGGALAQSAPPAKAGNGAAAPTTIGEIVVTAEKREANIQDVPEAVTAFTAQDRNIKGIETVQDLTNFTPGFTYSSQLDRPAMRGLARDTNIYAQDSSVAVYYDDFFSNSTFLVGRDDMLIDQVEILLGPQGTLYGRNAIGGLINTISKRPTEELSGEVRVIAGNYGYTKVEGTISGPLAPHLSFRLSGYDENQTQGWLQNVVPGMPSEGGVRHDPYGDFQLQYKTDKDELWLDTNVVGFNGDRGGPGSLLGTPEGGPYSTILTGFGQLGFNPNFPYGGGAVPGSVVGQIGTNNPTIGNIRDFAHAIATNITVDKAYTVQLHWIHHFDNFDVKYVGGYSQYHYELHDPYFANDNSPITSYQIPTSPACGFIGPALGIPAAAACTPLTVNPNQLFTFETQTDWFSHELTFSSTWNKPVQWIAGLYYYNETDNNPVTSQEINQAQYANPVGGLPNPGRYQFFLDYQDRIQSAAAYAQVDWKIVPKLKLTGGLRYTLDWKHGQQETRYTYFGSDVLAGTANAGLYTPQTVGAALPAFDVTSALIDHSAQPGVCSLPTLQTTGQFAGDYVGCLSDHSQALTGTAGIEWTPNDDTLIYARYNRGYKAFAFYAGYNGYNVEAKPEYVDDIEIGYKGTINNRMTIDADAFYYNYTNDQVPIGQTIGSGGVTTTTTEFVNLPRAISEGAELTINWNPIEHLNLNLTYGFDRTSIVTGCSLVNGVPTGACYEDAADPFANAPGARPVGTAAGNGVRLQAVNGAELPQAPENKIALNGTYTFAFDPGNLIFSATYIWKDKSYASVFTRAYDMAPSWDQVNLRAIWSGNHDKYEVVLFVNNLFNTLGYDAAAVGYFTQSPVGNIGGATTDPAYDLTPPRTFGMELHYKF
jgi:iron complex outermembrane receptor protein